MAKKKVKKAGLKAEVHHYWGWATLALATLIILGTAGYYYLSMINY